VPWTRSNQRSSHSKIYAACFFLFDHYLESLLPLLRHIISILPFVLSSSTPISCSSSSKASSFSSKHFFRSSKSSFYSSKSCCRSSTSVRFCSTSFSAEPYQSLDLKASSLALVSQDLIPLRKLPTPSHSSLVWLLALVLSTPNAVPLCSLVTLGKFPARRVQLLKRETIPVRWRCLLSQAALVKKFQLWCLEWRKLKQWKSFEIGWLQRPGFESMQGCSK